MPKTKPKQSKKTVEIPVDVAKRLFNTGNALADLAEDILESEGAYTDEFLRGLKHSQADVRAGRVQTITSLDDLNEE